MRRGVFAAVCLLLFTGTAVAQPWQFIVSGDSRSGRADRRAVAQGVMAKTGGDFTWWINTGDITADAKQSEYDNWISDMASVGLDYDWSSNPPTRWFNADFGNHERGNVSRFLSYFPGHANRSAYPHIPGHPQGLFGSFKHRGVLIVWLARYSTPSSQADFMARTAAAAATDPGLTWKFVHWHYPPAGCKGHGSDSTSDGWVDNHFLPAGFQAGFFGHNHNYVRTCAMISTSSKTCGEPGFINLTVGTAGASNSGCGCPSWVTTCRSQHGFLLMTVDGDSVRGEFYSVDKGEGSPANPFLEDSFTLGPPVPHCGDNEVNVAGEECDGSDDSDCPGLCRLDCSCGEPGVPALVNAGFEEGEAGWLDWASPGNAGEAVISNDSHTGTKSLQMFDSKSKTRMVYQAVDVTPGETYRLSFWAKGKNLGTDQANVRVLWADGTSDQLFVPAGTTPWAQLYREVTAPSGITARVQLVHLPVTDGVPWNDAEVWYDDIVFVLSSTPTTTAPPTTTTVLPSTSTTVGTTTTTMGATTTTTLPSDCEETLRKIRELVCLHPTTTIPTTTTTRVPTTTTTTGVAPVTTTTIAGVVTLAGEQGMWNEFELPQGTRVDATAATFTDRTHNLPSDKEGAITLKGGTHLSLIGGRVTGDFPRDAGWSYFHDGSRNHAGVLILSPHAQVERVFIDNVADGLRCQDGDATDFTVRGAHLTDIHDDAFDSHWQCTGLIEDVLVEGCYVFLSTRAAGRPRHPSRTITVRDSLIWQKPFPDPHSSESRNPGHGSTFKWDSDGRGPGLALHDNIFLWQQDSNGSIGFPGDGRVRIESCSNNIAVWVGGGSFPGNLGPPGCFTVTTDRSVWDNAVAAWKANH